VADGVLNAGVTERFVKAVVLVVRTAIHPPSRIRRLLACATVESSGSSTGANGTTGAGACCFGRS
jgi:hypothetical protein